jgi:hypothetical protein
MEQPTPEPVSVPNSRKESSFNIEYGRIMGGVFNLPKKVQRKMLQGMHQGRKIHGRSKQTNHFESFIHQ